MSTLVISRTAVNNTQHRVRIESGSFLPDAFFASGGRMHVDAIQNVVLTHPDENELSRLMNTSIVFEGMDRTRRDGVIHLLLREAPVEEEMDVDGEAQAATGVIPSTRQCEIAEPDERYQMKIASVFNTEISALARNIQAMQKEFDELFAKLIKLKRRIELALSPLNNNPIITQLIESIVAARRHAKVENAFISGNAIIVVTKQIISVPVSGSRRLVGKVVITLPLQMFVGDSPVVSGVRIYNLTHVINDSTRIWQAPHVVEDGSSCFGSTMQILFDAIVAKDVSLVASAVIQFLEQPNVADPYGRCATLLPVVMETHEG